jgi:hypothetical protein
VCGSMMIAWMCICGAEVCGGRGMWSGVKSSVDAYAVGVWVWMCFADGGVGCDLCCLLCVVWCASA